MIYEELGELTQGLDVNMKAFEDYRSITSKAFKELGAPRKVFQ